MRFGDELAQKWTREAKGRGGVPCSGADPHDGSGGEHSDPELAVLAEGPAGITLIQRLLFGSGGEHCDLELAAGEEGGRRKDEEGGPAGLGGPADKKINNPHLTGGELSNWMI